VAEREAERKSDATRSDAHPAVELLLLPRYSGHRQNPVEKVWWRLKQQVAANRLHGCLEVLEAAVHRCIATLTPQEVVAPRHLSKEHFVLGAAIEEVGAVSYRVLQRLKGDGDRRRDVLVEDEDE
jgi:hypothetical protein